ncbi:MAG: hypothetical protein AB1791_01630 [Chloroflexota bacterium]
MRNTYYLHCWIKTVLEQASTYKSVNFRLSFCVWIEILVILSACTLPSQTGSELTMTIAPDIEKRLTITATTSAALLEASTPVPVQVTDTPSPQVPAKPAANPSQTPHPFVETATINPTITPTLEMETRDVTGQLFMADLAGIQQVALSDGTSEYLLTEEDDWLDWGASFAKNQKYLAYWIRRADGTELWFTPLPQWQPERILVLDIDVEYDFAGPAWGVNDRYLLFNLFVRDNSGPLEDFKTIRTYVIDMETMGLVSQPYWPGDCFILAPSPQTGQLALWCQQAQAQGGSQEFLVLEPDEAPWSTPEAPEPLIDNCLFMAVCDWSQDGEFVAYVVTEDSPDSLFYASVDSAIPVRLDDKRTDSPTFLAWSPDTRFLYYAGACGEIGIQCPNVMSVADQKVIWRTKKDGNRGDLGLVFVDNLVWAPDSRHIAITTSGNINMVEFQVIIFDILNQQEISRITTNGIVLDMVWVDD